MPAHGRTVYVLGAGSSAAVGAPLQSELLGRILSPELADLVGNLDEIGLSEYQGTIQEFLRDVYGLATREECARLELEDLFTVVDRAILNETSIKGWHASEIRDVRRGLTAGLVSLMKQSLERPRGNVFHRFGRGLAAAGDSSAVISLNWDILADNAVWRAVHDGRAVDYGTEVEALHGQGMTVSNGLPRRQLFKLHGSLNWLVCPQCERLFVEVGEKIAYNDFYDPVSCRYCSEGLSDEREVTLRSLIVTPTMVKDLNSLHLRRVWTGAARALANCSRVVFIGYSFPIADFEFRYLIARSLPTSARIEVTLRTQSSRASKAARERYETFLGAARCRFFWDGFDGFVHREFGEIDSSLP